MSIIEIRKRVIESYPVQISRFGFCLGFGVGETLCDVYSNEHKSNCVDAGTALIPSRNIREF